jgi:hypothetical protein
MRRVWTALAAVGLAACAAEDMPAWELAGEPGLLFDIKQYYERNALEEGGRCWNLIFEGPTRWTMIEESADELTLLVGYYYRDTVRDDCSEFHPGRCIALPECRGFGERTFTVLRRDGGVEVVEMTGPQKARRPRTTASGGASP